MTTADAKAAFMVSSLDDLASAAAELAQAFRLVASNSDDTEVWAPIGSCAELCANVAEMAAHVSNRILEA